MVQKTYWATLIIWPPTHLLFMSFWLCLSCVMEIGHFREKRDVMGNETKREAEYLLMYAHMCVHLGMQTCVNACIDISSHLLNIYFLYWALYCVSEITLKKILFNSYNDHKWVCDSSTCHFMEFCLWNPEINYCLCFIATWQLTQLEFGDFELIDLFPRFPFRLLCSI